MKVFCPNCGTENDGPPGGRVTCRACTASYEVPFDASATPGPQPAAPPSFGGQPVQTFDRPAPQPAPAPAPVRPPPNVWAGDPPGSYAPPPAASGTTNTLAIVSLVSSLVGCFCIPGLGSLVGIITGFVAMSQINTAGGLQKGRELAIGGVAVGFLGCFGLMLYGVIAAIGGG